MSIYLRNIIRYFVLVLLQVLILNHIHLYWWTEASNIPPFTPYIYPLILLLLPLSTSTSLMMILGFFVGLTIDIFMNTGGMHAAVCVLIGATRNSILTALLPNRLSDYPNLSPGIRNMGWAPFLSYAAAIFLIHDLALYAIEIWSLNNIGYILLKTFASFITSMIFVVLYGLLFSSSSGHNTLND